MSCLYVNSIFSYSKGDSNESPPRYEQNELRSSERARSDVRICEYSGGVQNKNGLVTCHNMRIKDYDINTTSLYYYNCTDQIPE